MKTLLLYLGMAAAGYAAAFSLRKKKESFLWIGKVLSPIVLTLVFMMGFRIGANESVVRDLGTIGLYSIIIAGVSLLTTVMTLHFTRKTMGFDKFGHLSCGESGTDNDENQDKKAEGALLSKSTFLIMISVLLGFAAGFLGVVRMELVPYDMAYNISGMYVTYALYLMVFLVGMDMGFDGNIAEVFKKIGIRVMIFPVVTAVATIATVLCCTAFVPISTKEAFAIACTFGWYSLGPNIIMDAGMITAGAFCFLTNFFRVLTSLFVMPVVAKKVGYIETIGMPCAAAMDVCIATIEKNTSKVVAMYAFASGAIFTAAVPILVPLIVA